ncbi:F-box/WD-40 repeat-containing protein At3g52030 isoform X1 [Cucurbita maxima]|uniref:F-box/WD-40 repeat-containing protein At3g52030 isoform X1 n=2 Tax=Cucurbita maxima TaxID=3661 RepID=A0A6J1KSE3_CUCMA|nr:F-box/WD-40 repeat-containing protein At3g52030 isoform X1 [Cucurbita maxima]
MAPPTVADRSSAKRRSNIDAKPVYSLSHDILCIIFSFLDLFDLVRCSVVCKSWNNAIFNSELLRTFCMKHQKQEMESSSSFKVSVSSEKPLLECLEEIAMERHKLALEEGRIRVSQWIGHSVRAEQCRMKMGLILTGVGDKVMRLWSSENFRCLEEYSIPEKLPLIDFDFDESKIVGLVGRNMCIWSRSGKRSIFPSRECTFVEGSCMRYFDPEAVVGCGDGTAHVFDMYSRRCSRIVRMLPGPVTCLCVGDDQLILGGSLHGNIGVSGLRSDQRVAMLRSRNTIGIKTMCYNASSHLVFAGSTAGHVYCWDLRTMKPLWESRVSPNVVYSLRHLQNDRSSLAVGGIDGILRILDQNTGTVRSGCIMDSRLLSTYQSGVGVVEERIGNRLSDETPIDAIHRRSRPPITSLAVGMNKIVTTHNDKFIRLWKFRN